MVWKRASKALIRPGLLLSSVFLFSIFHFLIFLTPALAKVTGECVNCHTMHNSQDGSPMPGVGSISETGPFDALTRGTCGGCHSNTGSATVKALGSSNIPVVFNTVPPAAGTELAGGNFYWVVSKGQAYGHNVLTIPGITNDTNLTEAPGSPTGGGGACAICHDRIAACTSCHYPYHHGEDAQPVVGSDVQNAGNNIKAVYYRFLANGSDQHGSGGVMGIEDSDWERTKNESDHNTYAGGGIPASKSSGLMQDDGSMSNWCAGCHTGFHNADDTGTASPWLRHPNNYALPSDTNKEYRLYNTPDGSTIGPYNCEAPVARPDILTYAGDQSLVRPGTDQVMCLSCHKPHGSPYKDILRWDYDGMIAGTTGPTKGTGCFICHTSKDGV
ncbi:MAG: cytochrome c3 family protein [Thermodesulfobacteriota bacterium]|nr:cytochrome c3 family protein [Thermodesulfobacteriota bacterium]